MATITQDDAQAWLERQADRFINGGIDGSPFTSDVLPGITQFGVEQELYLDSLDAPGMYEAVGPMALVFHATWLGIELTTTRTPTRGERSAH
jgi:hypothetical protein